MSESEYMDWLLRRHPSASERDIEFCLRMYRMLCASDDGYAERLGRCLVG